VANQYTPLTTSGVVAVSGSSPVTVSLTAYMVSGGGALTAYTIYANVSAELFAFGSTGSNTLSAPGEVPDDDPLALPRGD
jgi:hypothetical protein